MWNKVLSEHFKRRPHERVVFLADAPLIPGPPIPEGGEIVVCPETGGHGHEPAVEVWEAVFGVAAVAILDRDGLLDRLLAKQLTPADQAVLGGWTKQVARLIPSIVIATTNHSTSHTSFRELLNLAGARYGSMPLYEPFLLRENGPLDIDQVELTGRTRRLAALFSGCRRVHLTTSAGTDLTFSTDNREFHCDDGDLARPGSFANLPAGEVYCAIREGSGEGVFVIEDGARVTVRRGACAGIEGETYLQKTWREHPEYLLLAEFGVGTNPRAERPDNVLEAEKILGTVHLAFGDNSHFGGTQQIPYHHDHVLASPRILADGRLIDPLTA